MTFEFSLTAPLLTKKRPAKEEKIIGDFSKKNLDFATRCPESNVPVSGQVYTDSRHGWGAAATGNPWAG